MQSVMDRINQSKIPIVKVRFNDRTIPAVDGRDIHRALGERRPYAKWVISQLAAGDYVYNRDFTTEVKSPEDAACEYYFSLASAREIALLANSPEGRQLRRYLNGGHKSYLGRV